MKQNLTIFFTALGFWAALASTTAPSQTLPTSSNTPASARTSSGGGLVFSGAAVGSWSQTRAVQCDFSARGRRGRAALVGAVTGEAWTFSLDIGSYAGPGTYNAKDTRNIRAVLDNGSHNPNKFFTSAKAGSVLITVAANEKSGTVQAQLWSDTGQQVRISGSWMCEG